MRNRFLRSHRSRARSRARVLLLALALLAACPAAASIPACFRDDAAMVVVSEAVFTAEVLDARSSRNGKWRRLDVRYRLTGVLKGILRPGQRIRVVDSCTDQPVPDEMLGSPHVEDYCRGGAPAATGVDEAGRPQPPPLGGWLLFLELSRGDHFWKEVSRTGFGSCSVDESRLGPADRRALQRLRERRPGSSAAPEPRAVRPAWRVVPFATDEAIRVLRTRWEHTKGERKRKEDKNVEVEVLSRREVKPRPGNQPEEAPP